MKYVLVTGASGGMGRETVKYLLSLGYGVFAADLREIDVIDDNIVPVTLDVTNVESVKKAYEKVAALTDSLYAIIHFAGIYNLDSLVEMDEADYERIVKVNFCGAYYVNKTFLPLLSKGSRILITTSELAPLDPLPFTGIYAVTKAALDKYAFSLRMELQLLDIGVSVLRAGAVATDMLGVSTRALDRFTEETKLYSCNAKRFKKIVEGVEARNVPCSAIAKKAVGIIEKRSPRFAYAINRNPLLLMLNALPPSLQFFAIRQVLK